MSAQSFPGEEYEGPPVLGESLSSLYDDLRLYAEFRLTEALDKMDTGALWTTDTSDHLGLHTLFSFNLGEGEKIGLPGKELWQISVPVNKRPFQPGEELTSGSIELSEEDILRALSREDPRYILVQDLRNPDSEQIELNPHNCDELAYENEGKSVLLAELIAGRLQDRFKFFIWPAVVTD